MALKYSTIRICGAGFAGFMHCQWLPIAVHQCIAGRGILADRGTTLFHLEMKEKSTTDGIQICGLLLLVLQLGASCASAQSTDSGAAQAGTTPSHLRLADRLDRPQDGYCVDVLGTADFLRPDLPLFAHNCKPRLTSDSAVVFDSKGQIRFSELNLCITVFGVNAVALPGATVLLRECDEATPFFEATALQRFTHASDGRLMLAGSQLCVAVGTHSATTYSPADRWRSLFVEDCDAVEPARARWEFVIP